MVDYFDEMVDAYGHAFKDMREVAGKTGDPELVAYENLDKAGFEKLRKDHGLEDLVTYIRRMEARRQGVK